jgi:hypothetical protein
VSFAWRRSNPSYRNQEDYICIDKVLAFENNNPSSKDWNRKSKMYTEDRKQVIRVTSKVEDRRASDPAYVAHVEMRSSFLSSSKLEYRRADDPAYVAHVERVSSFLSFLSGKKYGKLIRKFKPFQSF